MRRSHIARGRFVLSLLNPTSVIYERLSNAIRDYQCRRTSRRWLSITSVLIHDYIASARSGDCKISSSGDLRMVVRAKWLWRETSGPVTIESPLYTREDVKANGLPFMDARVRRCCWSPVFRNRPVPGNTSPISILISVNAGQSLKLRVVQ